jgi:DNA-binding NarL/FixJ family response regulator
MLTGSASASVVAESAAADAVGFLVKGDDPNRLSDAVRTVAAGGTVWPAGRPDTPRGIQADSRFG